MRYPVNDVQLFDRDLVDLVEDVDAGNVDPVHTKNGLFKDKIFVKSHVS